VSAASPGLTCREVSDFLGAYVAGELRASQRGAFESHLADCPDCRTYLDQYERTRHLAKRACDDAADAGVPEELVVAILAARSAAADGE
jgi:anti-sigma factor RsiW